MTAEEAERSQEARAPLIQRAEGRQDDGAGAALPGLAAT